MMYFILFVSLLFVLSLIVIAGAVKTEREDRERRRRIHIGESILEQLFHTQNETT